jgi:hemoglobin
MLRLHCLKEQFCYILHGRCGYSGRTMQAAHKQMGIRTADVNAPIEGFPAVMRRSHVTFYSETKALVRWHR